MNGAPRLEELWVSIPGYAQHHQLMSPPQRDERRQQVSSSFPMSAVSTRQVSCVYAHTVLGTRISGCMLAYAIRGSRP